MDGLDVAWQWLVNNGSGLAALAAVGTAAIAIIALRSTAADSRDRSRPYVLAELSLATDSDTTIDIVIRNAGLSVARNVHVRFDPVLVVPGDGRRYVTEYTVRRYAKPIPTLAPGQRLSNIWWSGHMAPGGTSLISEEPTPEECTVTIEYWDDRRRRYHDDFPLVVDTMLTTTYSVSSTSIKGRMKSIDESLEKVAGSLQKLAQTRKDQHEGH